MKELGNLAIVCAQRPDVLMQITGGRVSVCVQTERIMYARWDDDGEIHRAIHELNFGTYAAGKVSCDG